MMNPVVYNVSLDVYKVGSQQVLSMVRGDTNRKLVISLTENERPYEIGAGCTAKFTALKPDGHFIYNDCEVEVESNTIAYQITDQTIAKEGNVSCQIRLIGTDGTVITTPSFNIVVADLLYNEQPIVESSNEFNALTRFLADLQQKLENGELDGKSIYIKGSVADVSELETKIPTAVAGDGYLADDDHLYVFDGVAFVDVGAVRGPQGISGVYVGSGNMPDGYSVQIDPDGAVLEMDAELNAESVNPVANSAVAVAIGGLGERVGDTENAVGTLETRVGENEKAIEELTKKHNTEIPALDAKFSRVMYGGWASLGSSDMTKAEVDAAVDKQLQAWWDAMPSDSVEFFTLIVNTNKSTAAPGNNLIRMYKTVTKNLSYGTIETHSYQGSGLRRSILANEFGPWEHWGKYQVDTKNVNADNVYTANVETRGPELYLSSHFSSDTVAGGSGIKVLTVDDVIQTIGYVLPWSNGHTSSVRLGSSGTPWSAVYTTSGTIQTSSRDAKENIKNVISEFTPMTMSLRDEPVETSDITEETLVDFVRNLQPVTFNYKGDGSPDAEQLGLIADDIAEHPVYKYVGIDYATDVEVTPAKYDEQGNLIEETVTEKKRVLGLQAIPLAVTALTACKHLLNQLDNVYAINEDLQSQLDVVNARLSKLEGE
ncbi:MAG: BppU family phage baseplate upper protein [Clostridia bacterium]|nr:BppU family phage baseplate upper protein [Clostridia bacterium]